MDSPPLTVDRIQEDVQRLQTDWLLSLLRSFYSPSGCPPHGCARTRWILMIYSNQTGQQQSISEPLAVHKTKKTLREKIVVVKGSFSRLKMLFLLLLQLLDQAAITMETLRGWPRNDVCDR
jgi:hypothetical protein